MSKRISKPRNVDLAIRVLVTAMILGAFAVWDPAFRTTGNAYALLNSFALSGLIALGIGLTMIAGEFDISVGATVPLSGIVALQLLNSMGIVAAVAIATLVITCFGVAQGGLIADLRISSLPVTISVLIAGGGLTYVIAGNVPVQLPLQYIGLSNTLEERLWIFSPISLAVIGIYVVVAMFLRYARAGREIFAIGGGRAEAFATGVSRFRPLILVFGISALFAGLTGAMLAITSGGMGVGAQEGLLLGAVTAALIGGVGLDGGRGSVLGIGLGVLVLGALQAEIALRGLQLYDQDLSSGAVLLVVLAGEVAVRARQERSDRRAHGKASLNVAMEAQ